MAPCWELFVQLADYAWLRTVAEHHEQEVRLESGRLRHGDRGRPLLEGAKVGYPLGAGAARYGSPPDPTWISGIYDNADYDVVGLVRDGTGANDNQALPGG